jgi:hypothetical protein
MSTNGLASLASGLVRIGEGCVEILGHSQPAAGQSDICANTILRRKNSTTAPPFVGWEIWRFPPNLSGVHLKGMYLIGVCLIGVYLTGVHLMGIHFMGMHLIGVHVTGMCLRRAPRGRACHGRTSHGRAPHRRVSHVLRAADRYAYTGYESTACSVGTVHGGK